MSAGGGVSTSTSQQARSNMYRVGDYVYFENSGSGPFAIRRIEELNKAANGRLSSDYDNMFVTSISCRQCGGQGDVFLQKI